MVVTGECDRAALGRNAGEIGVAQRVARAIDAWPLAIPDSEDAIDSRAGKVGQLLGAQIAVAARSSLRPGRKTMYAA